MSCSRGSPLPSNPVKSKSRNRVFASAHELGEELRPRLFRNSPCAARVSSLSCWLFCPTLS